MSGWVVVHVHSRYRAVVAAGLAAEAAALDPVFHRGGPVTAGTLVLPAARFDPQVLHTRCPRAAWEAWWQQEDGREGRYAAWHPGRGRLDGLHRDRLLQPGTLAGPGWEDLAARAAAPRGAVAAVFAAAAADSRADAVAAALAGTDRDQVHDSAMHLEHARAAAGAVAVRHGEWVLTWDGGEGYLLETLDGRGRALSVMDQVSHSAPPPAQMLLRPWAEAHGWRDPVGNANPRLAGWVADLAAAPAGGVVPLAPAAAVGLVRPRLRAGAGDELLYRQWAAAVAEQLPGCRLQRGAATQQLHDEDTDRAVLLGPPGTSGGAIRAAGPAAAAALGWTGPGPGPEPGVLPRPALAAAAAVVRAGIEHDAAARGRDAARDRADALEGLRRAAQQDHAAGTGRADVLRDLSEAADAASRHAAAAGAVLLLAGERRARAWQNAAGHGFTAADLADLDGAADPGTVRRAIHGPGRGPGAAARNGAVPAPRPARPRAAATGVRP